MSDRVSLESMLSLFPDLTYRVPLLGMVHLQALIAAVVVFFVLILVFWLLRAVVLRRAMKIAAATNNTLDDVAVEAIVGVRPWVYTMVALYVSLQFFALPFSFMRVVAGIFYFTIVWQLIEVATQFLRYFVSHYLERDDDGDGVVDPNAATAAYLVTLVARIAFWSLGVLFVFSNMGIEVTSLIAGLGIGGIAVAFALQGVLSDLFASFSIYFDKPFRIGDYIVIGTDSGVVERIGIKSTRIRTLQGEELVVSNAELTTARVQNFKKMQQRRVVMQFGITYETPQERVKEVPGIVTRIFEALDGGRLDRVHFVSFGDSALVFEVVYYVESSDYTDYLNIQQAFNFDLMERFAEVEIDFAYPTQMIYTKAV